MGCGVINFWLSHIVINYVFLIHTFHFRFLPILSLKNTESQKQIIAGSPSLPDTLPHPQTHMPLNPQCASRQWLSYERWLQLTFWSAQFSPPDSGICLKAWREIPALYMTCRPQAAQSSSWGFGGNHLWPRTNKAAFVMPITTSFVIVHSSVSTVSLSPLAISLFIL